MQSGKRSLGSKTNKSTGDKNKRTTRSVKSRDNENEKPFDRRRKTDSTSPQRRLKKDELKEEKRFKDFKDKKYKTEKFDEVRDEKKVRHTNRSENKEIRKKTSDNDSTTESKSKYGEKKYKKSYSDRYDKKENRHNNSHRSPKTQTKSNPDEIRLNRYIANAGVCSRREADEYIKIGLVKINDVIITELGTKVLPGDVVQYNGSILKPEHKVYVLLNKPKDYITTTDDPQKRRTVMDLIGPEVKAHLYPVGRLDRNTTGVLLLTNDGDMAKRLSHPSHNKKKIYHAFLDKKVKVEHMHQLLDGITLDDGFIKADAIQYPDPADKSQIGVEIHSGKNRIVRRMLEHFEYVVLRLDRVYFAGLTKKGLERGHWRFLTEKEINMLKMGAYE